MIDVPPCDARLVTWLSAHDQELLSAWRELVFASYPEPAALLIRGAPDPFRNPLGHRVHEGTDAVWRLFAAGNADREGLRAAMDPLMRAFAIRGQRPSEAIEFVFLLKRAVRSVAGAGLDGPTRDALDARVDGLALAAFDAYSRCRDEIQDIRVRSMRRRVATIFDRLGADHGGADEAAPPPAGAIPVVMEVKA